VRITNLTLTTSFKIFPIAENAVTIDFGNVIDEKVNQRVVGLFEHWESRHLSFVKDLIPSYSTLTVVYDAIEIRNHLNFSNAFAFIKKELAESIEKLPSHIKGKSETKKIPVCYDASFGYDLESMSLMTKKTVEQIIRIHSSATYRVYAIGFLPGFAYMGKVDSRIATPRKQSPANVIAGSVAIAGEQTGIYPLDSPGGWNIIGRTPLLMFDPKRDPSCLLKTGDYIEFNPIDLVEFEKLMRKKFCHIEK
jgi:inhibitor of KinA